MKVGDNISFSPDKLETTFILPMTESGPIKDRKYTLIHSDTTGILFLDVGSVYNNSVIDQKLRDEVLGKWIFSDNYSYTLIFYVYVGDGDFEESYKRYNIFKDNLNLALQAIIYGDRVLFSKYPQLIETPIYVKFDSTIPIFDNYEFYGYVKNYMQ